MRRLWIVCLVSSMGAMLVPACGSREAPPAAGAVVIRNAIVVDGTGAPGRAADVRVAGGRIVGVGTLEPAAGERLVDARGLVLAPAFIDTHSHHDRGLTDEPGALAAVSQGIGTIVVGQDGSSRPVADLLAEVDAHRPAVNVATYIGHGSVRRDVMGDDFRRAATAGEVARMQALVEAGMRDGALGLSTGLEYDPGIYSTPDEVVTLARAVAPFGGRYISHIRSEDRALWDAVDEVIAVGRAAGIPVQLSHVKLAMKSLWGQADRLIAVLDEARAAGVDVTADVYPYTYWQSGMTVLFPARDFTDRAAAEFALRELVTPPDLLVASFAPNPAYDGRTLADIAAERRVDPAQAMMDLIRETDGRGPGIVATSMDEGDVERLLAWPFANVCSDGALRGAHPRGFGAFPRVLGRYVRERQVLTLEEAVRRMTSLAAANVGLTGRGTIAPGQAADLVLFDPVTVIDRATTAEPQAMSVGIDTVWVNGDVVFAEGRVTGARPGLALRRAGGQ
ncbi:MAG TPA: D-aminoacylase [Vicinamibacterales bacterium]|nr:D-aminoacylase [Vicinamibacterales bacterium]